MSEADGKGLAPGCGGAHAEGGDRLVSLASRLAARLRSYTDIYGADDADRGLLSEAAELKLTAGPGPDLGHPAEQPQSVGAQGIWIPCWIVLSPYLHSQAYAEHPEMLIQDARVRVRRMSADGPIRCYAWIDVSGVARLDDLAEEIRCADGWVVESLVLIGQGE
ncbi:hypothetical protein J2T57_001387 [Natronocella acetinitrilica]|uniref:Uncharacterized protein n=1 Tax=Natronocella acetinitrilica TaxID=414046 RepID=A0AAE3KAG7_9GAMM|nr:hypothetical protein [Natronocella acetinitrilica]MCP1674285.1 hypothetical protein [Natronocella acetinitrilica]